MVNVVKKVRRKKNIKKRNRYLLKNSDQNERHYLTNICINLGAQVKWKIKMFGILPFASSSFFVSPFLLFFSDTYIRLEAKLSDEP